MRHAILLGRKHSEEELSVLAGPSQEREIRDKFKVLREQPGDLAHIEVWTSDAGRDNRKFFEDPAVAKKAAADKATAEKEAADKAAAEKEAADKEAADKVAA